MVAPVNTVLPAITGTVTVGSAQALSDGTWTGVPTGYTYEWLRDGVVIAGEVTNAYTLALADIGSIITGRVTATNIDGSTPATSAGTITVPSTLAPEDGTVVAGADSYVTIAYADAYFVARGNAVWAALTAAQKEAALRKATDYMVQTYRSMWKGIRKDIAQTLDWPREQVYTEPFMRGAVGEYPYLVSNLIVPEEVKKACAELALRAAAADLAPDLEQAVVSETVGPLSVTYSAASPQYARYRAIDMMLNLYLTPHGAMVKLERS